ncbi:MAG TPA: hypothetical protein VF691_12640 [Cytophagaceae bacterium]|jgi:hypothetical protein
MFILRLPYIVFLILFSFSASAQIKQDTLVKAYFLDAKKEIENKNYEKAQQTFKKIMSLHESMPDELAYFLGYTEMKLKKYKVARDAFNKYLSLTGPKGQFLGKTIEAIKAMDCEETGFYEERITCEECDGAGVEIIPCRGCKGKGKTFCMVCGGTGVSKTKNDFGDKYKTCPTCEGSGHADCQKCGGHKQEKANCYACDGTGKQRVKQSCTANN